MNKDKINKVGLFWAMVCGSSSVDQNTNNLSLFNVFEEITVNNLSAQIPQGQQQIKPGDTIAVLFPHEVITVWSRDDVNQEARAEMKVEFIDPSGKVLFSNNPAILFEDKKQRMRIIMKINGMQITKPGLYRYVISLKTLADASAKEVATLPIMVKIAI